VSGDDAIKPLHPMLVTAAAGGGEGAAVPFSGTVLVWVQGRDVIFITTIATAAQGRGRAVAILGLPQIPAAAKAVAPNTTQPRKVVPGATIHGRSRSLASTGLSGCVAVTAFGLPRGRIATGEPHAAVAAISSGAGSRGACRAARLIRLLRLLHVLRLLLLAPLLYFLVCAVRVGQPGLDTLAVPRTVEVLAGVGVHRARDVVEGRRPAFRPLFLLPFLT